MNGIIDRNRFERCIDYLKKLDRYKNVYRQSVSLNSFLSIELSRSSPEWYMILLRRRVDSCILFTITLQNNSDIDVVSKIISTLDNCGDHPKCLICEQVSISNGYCELCSLMTTRLQHMCPICLDEDREEAVWVTTTCGHNYHYECMAKVNRKCPMCRTELNGDMKII